MHNSENKILSQERLFECKRNSLVVAGCVYGISIDGEMLGFGTPVRAFCFEAVRGGTVIGDIKTPAR